ncbi:MAG: hypothetical protein OHK0039_34020 [Bacteroidia bacterium]
MLMNICLLLSLALGLGLSAPLWGQSDESIFYDEFSDNRNNWWTGDIESGRNEIRYGQLYMEHKRAGQSWVPTLNIATLDIGSDFSIETRIRKIGGIQNNGFGISFGGSDKSHRYDFIITGDGHYSLGKVDGDGDRADLITWVKSDKIKTGDDGVNVLRIDKKGSSLRLSINGSYLTEYNGATLFGREVGFVIYRNIAIEIDYLHIDKAEGSFDAQTVFNDDFSDNRNNWWVGDIESGHNELRYGHLEMEHKRDGQSWVPMITVAAVDIRKDFAAETRIARMSGVENNGFGLSWGGNGKTQRYDFVITGNGYYSIGVIDGPGDRRQLKAWTLADQINRSTGTNTLRIEFRSGKHYFFINGTEVHQMVLDNLFGQDFGYVIYSNIAIKADYLRVDLLRPHVSNQPPVIVITDPDLARGFNVAPVATLRVAGRATDNDGIASVSVNNTAAQVDAYGNFTCNIPLVQGNNSITVRATDKRGAAATQQFTISRQESNTSRERRLALVIGNGQYAYAGSLRNPVNDARAMQQALESLGFTVLRYENCGQAALRRAIDEFGRQLANYDMGLFFYAGHGVQVGGNNYLIPVDAQLNNENDVEYDCVRADRVLGKMEAAGSKTNLVILDACRDNPFERSWSRSTGGGQGLAFMNAPSGSLIAYATSPGNTASDGSGTNGLYTSALLKHISTPGITVEQVFKRTRSSVVEQSAGKQTPWESTSLTGEFYFKQ